MSSSDNAKAKSTLKSVSQNDDAMTATSCRGISNNAPEPTQNDIHVNHALLEKILSAVNQLQQDVKSLDTKFSSQMSALLDKVNLKNPTKNNYKI